MTDNFGATSAADEVLAGVDLGGKRVLVTGVSAGLGVETARARLAHGAQVVGAARDLGKAMRFTSTSHGVRPYALDAEHAKALWARSEELVGERF